MRLFFSRAMPALLVAVLVAPTACAALVTLTANRQASSDLATALIDAHVPIGRTGDEWVEREVRGLRCVSQGQGATYDPARHGSAGITDSCTHPTLQGPAAGAVMRALARAGVTPDCRTGARCVFAVQTLTCRSDSGVATCTVRIL